MKLVALLSLRLANLRLLSRFPYRRTAPFSIESGSPNNWDTALWRRADDMNVALLDFAEKAG